MRFRLLTAAVIGATVMMTSCGSDKGSTPTVDTTAPGAVSDLTVSGSTTTTFTVMWTAPGDDNQSGQASAYDMRYSTSPITSGNFASATQASGEPTPKAAGASESMVIDVSSLAAEAAEGETYYFALRTVDEAENWSDVSNSASGMLVETTPPAAVSDLAVSATTDSSVTLEWTAPGDDGNTGTASQYDIRFSDATINTGNWASASQVSGEPAPQVAGSTQSMEIIVGSTGGTATWFFALRTTDDASNESDLSNVVSAEIGDDVPPSAISTLSIAMTTDTSVFLQWTATGDDGGSGTAAVFDIRYSNATITSGNWAAATTVSGEPTPLVAGSIQSMEVVVNTGAGSATWFFAMRARDDAGNESGISNVVSGTVGDDVPPSTVSDLSFNGLTDSSVFLTWTAPGDDGVNGTAAAYDIRYSSSTLNSGTWEAATQVQGEPSPGPASTTESMEIIVGSAMAAQLRAGANADETWSFGLRAIDNAGNESAISNVISSQLSDLTPPDAVSDLQVISVTDSSAVLQWTATGDDGTVGTASQYDIRFSTNSINEGNWSSATVATSEPTPQESGSTETFELVIHASTLAAMAANDQFFIAMRVRDDRGNESDISNVVSASLPDIVAPAAVNDLGVIDYNDTYMRISWTAPGDDGSVGTAAEYDIRYSTALIDESNFGSATVAPNIPTPQASGSYQVLDIGSLVAGTTYYVAMKTRDESNNWSPLSNVVTQLIPDTKEPNKISDLAVVSYDATSITITWTAVGDDYGAGTATAYEIRYQDDYIYDEDWDAATLYPNPPTPQPAGSTETFQLTGLTTGQHYYIAIRTFDDVNNSSAVSNNVDAYPVPDMIVSIPDPGLEAAVRADISKPTGDLTALDMAKVRNIFAGNSSVATLSGLEHAYNLGYAEIANNNVTDLTPLSNLSKLYYLRVDGNSITSLAPLANVTSLQTLRFGNNMVSSLAPLSGLTDLREISGWGNQITDLSPISGLTTLETLTLSANPLTSMTGIENLTNLGSVNFSQNAISDLSPLSGLTGIFSLEMSSCQITDLSPISGLTNIQYLGLNFNSSLANLSPLSNMTGMRDLSAVSCNISDLTPLTNMTQMFHLWLYNNDISSVAPLSGMTDMEEMSLFGNNISDLSPLSGMTKMTRLFLYDNTFSDLSPLSGMTQMTELSIGNNTNITSVSALSGMTQMVTLTFWHAMVSDLSPLSGMTMLSTLDASENPVVNISTLQGLEALTSLNLSYTDVVDLLPLVNNTGLGSGDVVSLYEANSLSAESINTHIPALEARGVIVNQ